MKSEANLTAGLTSVKDFFHLCLILKTTTNDVKYPDALSGHPYFFNQLSTGLDIVSLAGEWLTATANTNMFTYEIAPVFILMENECLARMREIIGFQGLHTSSTVVRFKRSSIGLYDNLPQFEVFGDFFGHFYM